MEPFNNDRIAIIKTGGERTVTRLSLRFFGVDLDPEEITRCLTVEPTRFGRRGDVVRNIHTGHSLRDQGFWVHDVEYNVNAPDRLVRSFLDSLPDDLAVWRRLTESNDADLLCSSGWRTDHGTVWLSPEALGAIAERGLYFGEGWFRDGDPEPVT
ncbi:MAG: DUF4279 domain-containing protein [Bacteroidota bacterium]